MNPTPLALCALLAMTGCTADTSDENAPLQVGEAEQAIGCEKYVCGTNSPILGGFKFYELDMKGAVPSPDGQLRIESFVSAGNVPLQLQVVGHTLYGIEPLGGAVQGAGLINSRIYITSPAYPNDRFRVRITNVTNVPFYDEGSGDTTESYRMLVRREPKPGKVGTTYPEQNLCPFPAPETWMFPGAGQDAVVFHGDRYDRNTGDITATGAAAGSWFNIACNGDALSKALITRHAFAARDDEHKASPAHCEAAVRMFRADYCGKGFAYTELGIPLGWANVGGWNATGVPPDLVNIEAIWDEGGAVCLTHPRLVDLDEVDCDHDIPLCGDPEIDDWQSLGHLITINP